MYSYVPLQRFNFVPLKLIEFFIDLWGYGGDKALGWGTGLLLGMERLAKRPCWGRWLHV